MLNSTSDFIDLLHLNEGPGIIASLDVESLFTNVPITKTIDIIIKYAYQHESLPPPKIPETILRKMLELCTKKAPFLTPNKQLYCQIEGVAMGSPLGPCFANFYMAHLENTILNNLENKPYIYARYVDDIFLKVKSEQEILKLKQLFEESSVLKFTHEMNIRNKLPFLDVLVNNSNNTFETSVYHKATDKGQCLNANSECCAKYKRSVITSYLNRAYKVTSNWQHFHQEINHIKQVLINNNYTNREVDNHIRIYLDKKFNNNVNNNDNKNNINIFYKNQWHENYKIEERIIKNIIKTNIKCKQSNDKINIIIYYKSIKTSNLVIKNNPSTSLDTLDTPNVIYKFKCNLSPCQVEYIGQTRMCLRKRLNNHVYKGSILDHYLKHHNRNITRNLLYENTKIIERERDYQRLYIKECLLILEHLPIANIQGNFYNILKLNGQRNITLNNQQNNVTAANNRTISNNILDNNTSSSSSVRQTPPATTTSHIAS